jgi:hypothetical protein
VVYGWLESAFCGTQAAKAATRGTAAPERHEDIAPAVIRH